MNSQIIGIITGIVAIIAAIGVIVEVVYFHKFQKKFDYELNLLRNSILPKQQKYEVWLDAILHDLQDIRTDVFETKMLNTESGRIRTSLDYVREFERIREDLKSLRYAILDNQTINLEIVSKIRTSIFEFQQKFDRVLNEEDKEHLSKAFDILNSEVNNISRSALCAELDYFIARFSWSGSSAIGDDIESKKPLVS